MHSAARHGNQNLGRDTGPDRDDGGNGGQLAEVSNQLGWLRGNGLSGRLPLREPFEAAYGPDARVGMSEDRIEGAR